MNSGGKCSRERKAQANSLKQNWLRHQDAVIEIFPAAREVLEPLGKPSWEGSGDAAVGSHG